MAKAIKIKNIVIGQGRPKICAIVMGKAKEEILELANKANEVNCDLIEFRADHFSEASDLEKLKEIAKEVRTACKKPIIFTLRTKGEGGEISCDVSYYKQVLTMIAECFYAELIDVEYAAVANDNEFVDTLKDFGSYVIISKHDFEKTPRREEIVKIFMDLQNKGADIVKVSFMPNSKKDVLSLINATCEATTNNYVTSPIVAISMGHLGMVTRILGEFLESAITFASITKASAPGQINIESLDGVLSVIHENYKKVFLVGFMGTGKTAVANALSNNYGLKKIDLDAYIEMKEGVTIADIFASQSESGFRDKETKYLRQILKQNYQVVSLGGGVILRDENVEMIKEKGVIVLLTAKPETILKRLENDNTRPLLKDNFDLDYIKNLMAERNEKYNATANMVISTDDKTIEEICKEIVETLGFNS